MSDFANTRLGLVLRRLKWLLAPPRLPRMGKNCSIHPTARIEGHPENMALGDRVIIDAHAVLYCHKEASLVIGDGSYVGDGAILNTGKKTGSITLGRNCTVQAYSVIYGNGGLEIGDFVRIAAHNVIVPANKIYADTDTPIYLQGTQKLGIKIGSDVWLGAGATVLDGVTIGTGVVIAAGAVVNRSIPEFSIAGGVPASAIGHRKSANKSTESSG